MNDPWIYAIKKWPGMPKQWLDIIDLRKVCRRGCMCTGYYTHSYMEDGFCSHHCRLEHNAFMKGQQ